MRATTIHAPGDIRVENRPIPTVTSPTGALVKVAAGCICGSDLWPYRGENPITPGDTIGHEAVGIVDGIGSEVTSVKVGDFVVVPFCHSDNVCVHCLAGFQSACTHVSMTSTGQAEFVYVDQAQGSLVATPGIPDCQLVPSLLTLTDVMATGWHAAVSARVKQGDTVVVVGDGAVGLCGVLASIEQGAERVIAMSRHADRQVIAREFGATDIVEARGDEAVAAVLDMTGGTGADAVLECVGTDLAMTTAFEAARPGAMVGFVGVPHGVTVPMRTAFVKNVGLAGGMAPVRRYLPDLMDRVLSGRINPGRVFDMTLPLDQVAEGYRAMDERRAIKVMLQL